MENKKKLTKQDITATDAIYIIFTVILGFCFIACAVVSIFIIAACCVYLVQSAHLMEQYIAKAYILTILMLLSSALFIYLDVRIFKTLKSSIQDYLKERKEILSELEDKPVPDQPSEGPTGE